ncbi:hypothetical protein ACWKWA_15580, partial [Dermacoccus abyssi]
PLYRRSGRGPVPARAGGVNGIDSGVVASATRARGALAHAGKALDGVHGRRPAPGLSGVDDGDGHPSGQRGPRW